MTLYKKDHQYDITQNKIINMTLHKKSLIWHYTKNHQPDITQKFINMTLYTNSSTCHADEFLCNAMLMNFCVMPWWIFVECHVECHSECFDIFFLSQFTLIYIAQKFINMTLLKNSSTWHCTKNQHGVRFFRNDFTFGRSVVVHNHIFNTY
jgi:hypothetical protein